MAAAAEAKEGRSHCMLSVVGLEDETLRELCAQALDQTPPGSVCQIANYLFPKLCAQALDQTPPGTVYNLVNYLFAKGRVISGRLEGVEAQIHGRVISGRLEGVEAQTHGRVISGHLEALEVVQKTAMERGAMKVVMLAVSGAFHTSLMGPARAKLEKEDALPPQQLQQPRHPMVENNACELE
eukprot:gene30962-17153_t